MITRWLHPLRRRLSLPTVASRPRHKHRRPVPLALEALEDRLVPSAAPALSISSLPADTVNVAYNQNINASGGTGNLTLQVSNVRSAIPGLNITGNGTGSIGISGKPTTAGIENFTVTGTDSAGNTTGPVNYSITVDPPLIVTSYVTNAVYEFDPTNGALLATLVAPNSQSILEGPAAVTIGPDGNLYITGEGYNGSSFTGPYNICEYNFSTHTLSTFISGAQMEAANGGVPFAPGGIAFGPDGNLYTDNTLPGTGADQVIRFNITNNGGQLSYNGTSATIATGLTTACDITFGANPGDQGNLYVSDDNSVLKITNATGASPTSSTFVSPGNGGLTYSCGLVWHGGNLYDTDPGSGQVLEYSATGSLIGNFTGSALQNPNQQPINTLFLPDGDVVTSTFGPGSGFLVGTQGNEAGSLMLFNSSGQLLQNIGANAFPPNASGVTGVALAYMTFDTTPSPISISPNGGSLPAATEGTAYYQSITANGGNGTLSLSTNPATLSLPTGLTASISGSTLTISGTPTAVGVANFSVTASDTSGDTQTQNYTLAVNAAGSPTITSGASAVFTVGQGGSFLVTATGSPTPTLTESGDLPTGVTFTANGNGTASLSGTPVAYSNGTYTIAITAHNGIGDSTQTFTITVNPSPLPPPPPPPLPAPPTLNVPPLLAFFDFFLGGTETVNANGTETITDSFFGFPLLVSTFNSAGNLESVSLLGFNITLLFELL